MEWHWNDERIEEFLTMVEEGRQENLDYIGALRSGDLCFDLLVSEDCYFHADLYVGGIDTGYGYSDSGYPYEFVGDVGKEWELEYFKGADIFRFKNIIEKELSEIIKKSKPLEYMSGVYYLQEIADKELHVW